ncbi:hypothetical protein LZ31DRAFT_282975 [Colletotrichum somersetense]|nr:hypothetical protein LZ31DRAFT_282975 [Colletotrichum somersetense]
MGFPFTVRHQSVTQYSVMKRASEEPHSCPRLNQHPLGRSVTCNIRIWMPCKSCPCGERLIYRFAPDAFCSFRRRRPGGFALSPTYTVSPMNGQNGPKREREGEKREICPYPSLALTDLVGSQGISTEWTVSGERKSKAALRKGPVVVEARADVHRISPPPCRRKDSTTRGGPTPRSTRHFTVTHYLI